MTLIGILRKNGSAYFIEQLPDNYIYLNAYSVDRRTGTFIPSGTLKDDGLKDFSVDQEFYYAHKTKRYPASTEFSRPSLMQDDGTLLSKEEYGRLTSSTDKDRYERGIIRHLGVTGRDSDMPRTKKHEIFIPYPSPGRLIALNDSAMDDFNELAREAHERDPRFPFTPFGRHDEKSPRPVELREGDLLYYSTCRRGLVDKLSFSACWRDYCGGVGKDNDAFGFFRKVDGNGMLLPPGLDNQGADDPAALKLTPVPALLGFTEEKKHEKQKTINALAGRLHFSPGILSPGNPEQTRDSEKTLKILATPKPPCPEFYFHRDGDQGRFITKRYLQPDGTDCMPNGRKWYWHHPDKNDPFAESTQYVEDHYRQVCRIEPIKEGSRFLFSIDFVNLTEFELGLLLYALRPQGGFRHLIGMGKPLGMGRIRIDVLNVLFVDRDKRYGEDPLFGSRFYHSQTGEGLDRIDQIRKAYRDEKNDFQENRFCAACSTSCVKKVGDFVGEFKRKIQELYGEEWLVPLEIMGDPASTQGLLVRYPPDPEHERSHEDAYKWWMRNAGKERGVTGLNEMLPALPVDPGSKAPTLHTNPSRPRR